MSVPEVGGWQLAVSVYKAGPGISKYDLPKM